VALEPAVTGLGVCVPTVVAVIVRGACTTKFALELVIELVPHPLPAVVDAVTVKGVVDAGVEVVVEIVRVDVVALFVTVVGLNEAVAPVGAVQLIVRRFDVQLAALPAHVVVIVYVAEEPAVTGLGVCVPTVVAVMVSGVGADTTRLKPALVALPAVPHAPAVLVAVTVKPDVVPGGVEPVVAIVSVVVAEPDPNPAVTFAGLNEAVAPVGRVPFKTIEFVVQLEKMLTKLTVTV